MYDCQTMRQTKSEIPDSQFQTLFVSWYTVRRSSCCVTRCCVFDVSRWGLGPHPTIPYVFVRFQFFCQELPFLIFVHNFHTVFQRPLKLLNFSKKSCS